jgi:hypothetical protein
MAYYEDKTTGYLPGRENLSETRISAFAIAGSNGWGAIVVPGTGKCGA